MRERKVLKLITNGLGNKEIAATMRLSPSTVKRHVENILRKLHVKNRVEAAVYAVRTGACELEGISVARMKG
jgi:DNA-binding NarL/FixJ family response regulator